MKFLVIDDHPMIREGLVGVLKVFDADAQVLQAADSKSAMALLESQLQQKNLDCVLLDLQLGGISGFHLVEHARSICKHLPILVFSSSEDPCDVRRAFALGANGYCVKSGGNDILLAALRVVMAGQQFVPHVLLASTTAAASDAQERQITERQLEVLRLMAQGLPNKLIARQLHMQEQTVKGHVSAIFRCLGANNRVMAVDLARRSGLLAS